MNNQYNQQPQYQQQYAPQPPRPMIDPAVIKQQRKDSFFALSEKIAAFMQTNPLLRAIAPNSDIISYIVTGVSAIITIVAIILHADIQILALTTLIFAFFSLSKKSLLPIAVALSVISAFLVVFCITSIVFMVKYGELNKVSFGAAELKTIVSSLKGPVVLEFIFLLLELGIFATFSAFAWIYFAATLPPRAYNPQPYYGAQPMQQPMQQPMHQPMQQPVQQPMQQPVQPQTPVQNVCGSCGSVNTDGSAFCKTCGNKLA